MPAACTRLERAALGFDQLEMSLHAAAARCVLGRLRQAEGGEELLRAGEERLRDQGIENPARMAGVLVPGTAHS